MPQSYDYVLPFRRQPLKTLHDRPLGAYIISPVNVRLKARKETIISLQ